MVPMDVDVVRVGIGGCGLRKTKGGEMRSREM